MADSYIFTISAFTLIQEDFKCVIQEGPYLHMWHLYIIYIYIYIYIYISDGNKQQKY